MNISNQTIDQHLEALFNRIEQSMKQDLRESAKFRAMLMDVNDKINEVGHFFVDSVMPETLEIPEGHTEAEMEAVAQDLLDFTNRLMREVVQFGKAHAARQGEWCVENMEAINKAYSTFTGGNENE